jgi:hypothetical protein
MNRQMDSWMEKKGRMMTDKYGWNGEIGKPFCRCHNKDWFGQELSLDNKYRGDILTWNRILHSLNYLPIYCLSYKKTITKECKNSED